MVSFYQGDNSLIVAAWYGHKEIVEILLLKGADISVKNNDG